MFLVNFFVRLDPSLLADTKQLMLVKYLKCLSALLSYHTVWKNGLYFSSSVSVASETLDLGVLTELWDFHSYAWH